MAKPKWKPYKKEQEPAEEQPKQEAEPPKEEPKPKAEQKPAKEEKQRRYEVSLAKIEDPCCYVINRSFDKRNEADAYCVELAEKEGRECIVWDNEEWCEKIVFRHKPKKPEEVKDDRTQEQEKTRRGRGGPRPKHKP